MLIKSMKDWKQFLDSEDEEKLNRLLKEVAKHRGAYRNADDVKIAQLWSAFLEMRKENDSLRRRVDDMESIFEFIYSKMKKRHEEREELFKSLEKF